MPRARFGEPQVDAGQIAGGHRAPGRARCPPSFPLSCRSGLRKLTGAKRAKRLPVDRELSLPMRFATAAAILRALPEHAHAAPEIGGRIGPHGLQRPRVPCSTSTRSMGAVPMTSAASRIARAPGRMMSPIMASCTRLACAALELRVFGRRRHRLREACRANRETAACRSCRSGGGGAARRTTRRA